MMDKHMNEQIQHFIMEADAAIEKNNYIKGSRLYEKAAENSSGQTKAELYRKASKIYRDHGMYSDAARCYQNAVKLLEGDEKAACLFWCWEAFIEAIVHFEYDCSFEWRGETNSSHDSYLKDIKKYQKKAKKVLKQAFSVKGIDKNILIEKARAECRKREQEGGYGASRCWDTIGKVI
jgi:hypothetical protein